VPYEVRYSFIVLIVPLCETIRQNGISHGVTKSTMNGCTAGFHSEAGDLRATCQPITNPAA
jgi:hypothetical protein